MQNNQLKFLATAAMTVVLGMAAPAFAGPLALMGIDAEDGGPGAHGPISVYQNVVSSLINDPSRTNGGSGILVIGGGKDPGDHVTQFWNAISTVAHPVSYTNGANISTASFSGYAMIAIASDWWNTPDGGLSDAENNLLTGRSVGIANFVNGGGALLGLSSFGLTNPYGYLGGIGSFVASSVGEDNITPTAAGLAMGITNSLDVCCWHDAYQTYPAFLSILATYPDAGGKVAAVGGVFGLPGGPVLPGGSVPEPTSLLLLGSGLMGLAFARKARR